MITKTRVFELKPDEYMNNGVPYCKKCKTARYFVREDFCVPCKCECQMEEIRQRDERERQQKLAEYLQNLKNKSLLAIFVDTAIYSLGKTLLSNVV